MRIEITDVRDDHTTDNGSIWQLANYTIDGVPGPGRLGRWMDEDGPCYNDHTVWNVRGDARCIVSGIEPQEYPAYDGEDEAAIDVVEAAIRAAWERFDEQSA